MEKSSSVQEQLLEALILPDIVRFRELLNCQEMKDTAKDNKLHYNKCLEIACRNDGREEFVKALLTKVKPNINQYIVPEPIHHAAQFGCDKALEVLLKHKKTKVNAVTAVEWTALHFLAKNFKDNLDPETRNRFERCIQMLVTRPDIDVNRINNKGCTPIHHAAYFGNKNAVLTFLRHGFYDVDLDNIRGIGKTAREVILQKFPELEGNLPPHRNKWKTHPTPQMKLLAALNDGDLDDFCSVLKSLDANGKVLINPDHWYGKNINTTCMEMACKEEGKEKFISVLLQAGADPNKVNPIRQNTAIHVAAETGNLKALEIILSDNRTNANAVDQDGKTALHYAVMLASTDQSLAEKCLTVILEHPAVDINKVDKEGHSPVFISIQQGSRTLVEAMLRHPVDLNYDINGETIRQRIMTSFPDLELNLSLSGVDHRTYPSEKDIFFQYIYNKQIHKFLTELRKTDRSQELSDSDNGTDTFLQYACQHGLVDVVDELLQAGANPNLVTVTNTSPPLVIACSNQHYSIVPRLVNIPGTVIDNTDRDGRTALHYAAESEHLDTVLVLLNHGANVHITNTLNETALSPEPTASLLNKCIRVDDRLFPKDDNYKIIFDCELLVPRFCKPSGNEQTQNETAVLIEPGKANVERLHYEMNILYFLCQSERHNLILNHPVVTTFLSIKWQEIRKLFFANLFLYILLLIFLNIHIFTDLNLEISENLDNDAARFPVPTYVYKSVLGFLLIYLSIREAVQMLTRAMQYFTNVENYIDLGVIIFIILTFISWEKFSVRQTVRVMAIFLSWTELFLMLGRHPQISFQYNLLRRVSCEFLKFLMSYFIILVAFASSFYIMFGQSSGLLFDGWFSSMFKSFVMMTGEYELKDGIPLHKLPVVSHMVFTLFVFLVAIVMFHMLTGLAVGDVAALRREAQCLGIEARIRLMYDMEHILLPLLHRTRTCLKRHGIADCALSKCVLSKLFTIVLFRPGSKRELYVMRNKGLQIGVNDDIHTNEGVIMALFSMKPKIDIDTVSKSLKIISDQTKFQNMNHAYQPK